MKLVACRRSLIDCELTTYSLRAMQSHIVANLPGQQRMLLRRIVPNQQNRRRGKNIGHAGGRIWLAAQRRRQGREVGRAVMIDVVGLQHYARELREQIMLLRS